MDNLRVLVVDDEIELVSTLAERLEMRNFPTDVVTTAEEAIKSVTEKDYDVVLLDVVLQKTRGTDILEEIKMARPEAAVILVSGRSSEEAYEEGIKKGAFDYLVKPVQIERLIETMNKAVDSIKGRQR